MYCEVLGSHQLEYFCLIPFLLCIYFEFSSGSSIFSTISLKSGVLMAISLSPSFHVHLSTKTTAIILPVLSFCVIFLDKKEKKISWLLYKEDIKGNTRSVRKALCMQIWILNRSPLTSAILGQWQERRTCQPAGRKFAELCRKKLCAGSLSSAKTSNNPKSLGSKFLPLYLAEKTRRWESSS